MEITFSNLTVEITLSKSYDILEVPLGEVHIMNKHKHLQKSERDLIESHLNNRLSFRSIGKELGKDPTTISKEVKNHIYYKKSGAYGRAFNDCLIRKDCTIKHICDKKGCKKKHCCFCNITTCTMFCPDYQKESCERLSKPPYVCNGCEERRSCTLEKRIYKAFYAQKEYEHVRSESRQGIQLSEEEAIRLDSIISPLIIKGQSLHHICINHSDEIMWNERTLYNYVDYGIFTAKNIDMPRVIRMSKRKKKKNFKVDKKCRIGRTYHDFKSFTKDHPDLIIVEMDTVEGTKGGKVLLTLHFTIPQLMFAFIRDANTSRSVIDIINRLYLELRPDIFADLFQILLTDNGSEFSNPKALEFDFQDNRRTHVFYCDPGASFQKGAVENNHTLIRRIIPKGRSMDSFTQNDINKMMSHINSYGRGNLGDKSPYEVFASLYGEDILKMMGLTLISPDDIELNPSLLK
jgi:IS30 family transposase